MHPEASSSEGIIIRRHHNPEAQSAFSGIIDGWSADSIVALHSLRVATSVFFVGTGSGGCTMMRIPRGHQSGCIELGGWKMWVPTMEIGTTRTPAREAIVNCRVGIHADHTLATSRTTRTQAAIWARAAAVFGGLRQLPHLVGVRGMERCIMPQCDAMALWCAWDGAMHHASMRRDCTAGRVGGATGGRQPRRRAEVLMAGQSWPMREAHRALFEVKYPAVLRPRSFGESDERAACAHAGDQRIGRCARACGDAKGEVSMEER